MEFTPTNNVCKLEYVSYERRMHLCSTGMEPLQLYVLQAVLADAKEAHVMHVVNL